MNYRLTNLIDGKEPGWEALRDDYKPKEGEVVVNELPAGKVWDSESESLRTPSQADEIRALKEKRKAQLKDEALSVVDEDLEIEGEADRQVLMLLAAAVTKNLVDPRLETIAEVGGALMAARNDVDKVDEKARNATEQVLSVELGL